MFFREIPSPSEPLVPVNAPEWLAPTDEGAAWKENAKPPSQTRFLPILKIAAAIALVGVGAFAGLSERGFVASDNAVVSSRLISLRAPIDGIVSGVDGGVGTSVIRGQPIANIENPRFNNQHLVELRENLKRLRVQLKNAETEKAALLVLHSDLERRVAIHAKANAERLVGLVAEGEKTMAALVAKQSQAELDVQRRTPLQARGIVSRAEAERLETTLEGARNDVGAQQGRLESLRAEATAAKAGVLSGPGGIDVSYSAQRADQIAIEAAHLTRLIADLATEVESTSSRLSDESQRAALLRSASLRAPVDGMIWRLGASNEERLATGDMAVEIVDCGAAVLLAAIPQDRFSDIKIGATARYRLSGELVERTGAVLSVTGQGDLAHDQHYATTPVAQPTSTIIAQIEMRVAGDAAGPCLIGRTARVLLPTSGGGLLDRIFRRVV